MSFYRGMTCENVTLTGDKGTPITAYVARPAGPGPSTPERRADPPSSRLERTLHRDDASVRASRLPRDLRQPL